MLHYLDISNVLDIPGALPLAGCILFGGFLGLFDDWADLRWRYKAFTPVLASLPMIALRIGDTTMATYFFGKVDFGIYYYILIIPLIITVTTNTVNQLGGLNGLETICPLIVLTGLALVSNERILLYIPILICLVLAMFNYSGKIFVGNTGSFAVGITMASYAIITNVEQTLLLAILPYLFNSSLILFNYFFFRKTAHLILEGNKLYSLHRHSLQTLIAHNRHLSEHQIVQIISLIMLCSTTLAVLVWLI
jgi:UDP-N-acetylglucosamine--dolichyl-phosphate N-acetylglucosaminephosphotransferase